MDVVIVLLLVGWLGYVLYRAGKRTGSRQAFRVGRDPARRRKGRHG